MVILPTGNICCWLYLFRVFDTGNRFPPAANLFRRLGNHANDWMRNLRGLGLWIARAVGLRAAAQGFVGRRFSRDIPESDKLGL